MSLDLYFYIGVVILAFLAAYGTGYFARDYHYTENSGTHSKKGLIFLSGCMGIILFLACWPVLAGVIRLWPK